MTQPISPRPGTAPLTPTQTVPWSTNWTLGTTPATSPSTPSTSPAGQGLARDSANGIDGVRVLQETANGQTPASPGYDLPTPPKVELPAPIIPDYRLSGSTQNQIDTLIRVQQSQFDTIAAAIEGLGFKIDPKKTSIGLTESQKFYSLLVGVLMGAEDALKDSKLFQILHKLYVSMPSNLSDQQLADLADVQKLLEDFQDTVNEVTETRIKINQAKQDNKKAEAASLEASLKGIERQQENLISRIVAGLQNLNYTIDESKTSLGLSESQEFYANLTGVFVGAEDAVKEIDAFRTLHQLFVSMPSELSSRQLANLTRFKRLMDEFNETVKNINGLRVDLAKAKADNDKGEIKRLEQQIEAETEAQKRKVRDMVSELQRLNYRIDPEKISIGLSSTQSFYSALTGVLMGVENEVRDTESYKTLHQLFMSMPKELSREQLENLSKVTEWFDQVQTSVHSITSLRIQINDAKADKNESLVKQLEAKIKDEIETQKRLVASIAGELLRLGYEIDPSKISTGLTDSQKFYADMVGVLQGAEDDVRDSEIYRRFNALYLSMPNELSEKQLSALKGVSDKMAEYAKTVADISMLRQEISRAKNAKDNASVARYERQIAEKTKLQEALIREMVAGLEAQNFKVDPEKTRSPLSPSQSFYGDLVGVLVGVEDSVKSTDAYTRLHHLYASMPSELTQAQLNSLSRVNETLADLAANMKAVNEAKVSLNRAKSDKQKAEAAQLESRIKGLEREQAVLVEKLVSQLSGLGFKVDESKISLGLTPTQAFYNDLSGILTMAEDEVKKSDSYKRLAQLYASMPSELTPAQLQQLRDVWARIRGVDPISDQINALRVLLVEEKNKEKNKS